MTIPDLAVWAVEVTERREEEMPAQARDKNDRLVYKMMLASLAEDVAYTDDDIGDELRERAADVLRFLGHKVVLSPTTEEK